MPDPGVPGARDAAAAGTVAGEAFRGHQPETRHQLAWVRKTAHVPNLNHKGFSADQPDAPQRLQPFHGRGQCPVVQHILNRRIEALHPLMALCLGEY